MSVEIKPRPREQLPSTKFTIKSRDLRPSSRLAMRTYLRAVDVPVMIDSAESCEKKLSLLETIIRTGLDSVLPVRSKRICTTEPPWITSTLKQLIKERQRALSHDNLRVFRYLRNRVNRERKVCRAKYYQAKVEHLKDSKPSVWWREVKKLSCLSSAFVARDSISKPLQQIYATSDESSLANIINEAFLSPMCNFTPLPTDYLCVFTESLSADPVLVVSVDSVYRKLSKLNPTKAQGPDGIPGWLLKENADLLVGAVTDILNCSYREGHLPTSWKEADIMPIPKKKPIQDVNKHLRPISLTPILSKVAEEFVVDGYVKPAVMEKLNTQQFGTVPRSCTTHALISMIHSRVKSTDGNGATTRVVLFDFRKAFDLIDHCILAEKLTNYNIPRTIVCWILDFLMCRKQRVKLSSDCYSRSGELFRRVCHRGQNSAPGCSS